jgi:hypothetical protein
MKKEIPPVLEIVELFGDGLEAPDGDGPADPEDDEGYAVVDVVGSEEVLVAVAHLLLQMLLLLLVLQLQPSHLGHALVLYQVLLVDLAVEDVAEEEGQRHGHHPGHRRRPADDSLAGGVLGGDDDSDDEALDGPLVEDDGKPREFGEEFLMGDKEDGVPRVFRPLVVGEGVLVEDALRDGVREEVEQPKDEDGDPDEPEGRVVSERVCELHSLRNT